MRKIFFHFADKKAHISNTTKIKDLISKIFQNERVNFLRIDYIFCSDEYLLRLNNEFLQHNFYTDVISFPLNEFNTPVTGEIYISVDRVKENTKNYNLQFQQEILNVIIHGALHLCGYKDKTKKQIELMRLREKKYSNMFKARCIDVPRGKRLF